MKRDGWYCSCCEAVVFEVAYYDANEDHTCGMCCEACLIPVVVTDEPLIGGSK